MYGTELQHSQRLSRKGQMIYSVFGEIFPGYLIRHQVNRRYLKRHLGGSSATTLEIGSANGASAFWLSRNKLFSVDGIDIDERLVEDCEAIRATMGRTNVRFICADAAEVLAQRSYDVVISTHVLEHVRDDVHMLTTMYRSLKPGGLLLLQVPFGDPSKVPCDADAENGHVREGYSREDIVQKLEVVGFEIMVASGGVGRIGRFAYRMAIAASRMSRRMNASVLVFPLTYSLVALENLVSYCRLRPPSFEHSPFVAAGKPL